MKCEVSDVIRKKRHFERKMLSTAECPFSLVSREEGKTRTLELFGLNEFKGKNNMLGDPQTEMRRERKRNQKRTAKIVGQ